MAMVTKMAAIVVTVTVTMTTSCDEPALNPQGPSEAVEDFLPVEVRVQEVVGHLL